MILSSIKIQVVMALQYLSEPLNTNFVTVMPIKVQFYVGQNIYFIKIHEKIFNSHSFHIRGKYSWF